MKLLRQVTSVIRAEYIKKIFKKVKKYIKSFFFLMKSIVPHFVFVRTSIVYKDIAIPPSQFEDITPSVMY